MSNRRSDLDLSGRWTGFFNYPVARPPVNFEADLRDVSGAISGVTTERGDSLGTGGRILHAVLEGRRDGSSVRFVKMYDELDGEYDFVHYDGRVQAGGDEIEGRWEIPGAWAGTFLMVRASGASEEVELEVEAPVERDV